MRLRLIIDMRHRMRASMLKGTSLKERKRYQEAESALLPAHADLSAGLGPMHDETITAVRVLVDLYDAWGKPDKAAEWRAKLPTEQEAVAKD